MQYAHARDRRRGHLDDLPPPREVDELRAIQRREIEHLLVVKEFEDATTAVDDATPLPPASEENAERRAETEVDLDEIDDGVDPA